MAQRRTQQKTPLWKDILSIIIIVAVVLVFRMIAFAPFNIPSGSMIPTLAVGDYLFVSKYSYGYSQDSFDVPFLGSPESLFSGRVLDSPPERGDVVVFRGKNNKGEVIDFIKRVVGLPGDRIKIVNEILHINGVPVERRLIDPAYVYAQNEPDATVSNGRQIAGRLYEETLPNGVVHPVLQIGTGSTLTGWLQDGTIGDIDPNNTPEYIVKPDHFFMMGDNRDNSSDSRSLMGTIHYDRLVGKAQVLFFSVDGLQSKWWEVWNWPAAIRTERLFQAIK